MGFVARIRVRVRLHPFMWRTSAGDATAFAQPSGFGTALEGASLVDGGSPRCQTSQAHPGSAQWLSCERRSLVLL